MLCLLALFSVLISKTIICYRKKKVQIITVWKRNNKIGVFVQGLHGSNNVELERRDETSARIIHVKPAPTAENAEDDRNAANEQDHDNTETANYNLDTVGLYVIIASLFFMGIIRFLNNLDLEESYKNVVAFLYDWLHLAIDRAFGASLPPYFLLRKDHSKAYAKRKFVQFMSKFILFNSGLNS